MADTDGLVERVRRGIVSYLFEACQPDRGDVFSWCDDHAEEIARAALASLASRESIVAETVAAIVAWLNDDPIEFGLNETPDFLLSMKVAERVERGDWRTPVTEEPE